jgi:hypothetical protein
LRRGRGGQQEKRNGEQKSGHFQCLHANQ